MDIDLSQSDMSRLTTMLTVVGAPFERSCWARGLRIIEIGNIEFYFTESGAVSTVVVRAAPQAPSEK